MKRTQLSSSRPVLGAVVLSLLCMISVSYAALQFGSWPGHSHDAQHTGVSSVASQPFGRIRWATPVDLAPPDGTIFIHYGSPLVTAANTVIVPVKTGFNSFRVEAHNGATGAKIWTLSTGYSAPADSFVPGVGATLSGGELLVPDTAGGVIVRHSPDSAHGAVHRLYFYGLNNYLANPQAYQQGVQINTPLTADAQGNLYFGFQVNGPTPIGLQSGLARIAPDGTGTWVSATSVSGDPSIAKIEISCAPALSRDGRTVYFAVNSGDFGFGYLMALDSSTLAVINKAFLVDPWSGSPALMPDESSASPMVGPDGDVYFGVLEDPFLSHNDRGWLLHFNSDLSQQKTPGSFGWDDTPTVVDARLVASYHGSSKYLIMTKYNNYASLGTGDGHNRVAILDPNATETDPVLPPTQVMREVITQLGVTPDPDFPNFPGAVREWCINAAAVDPYTKAVMVNSEDGKLYRWDLTSNKLTEKMTLAVGIGEAYTPTVIGADGTVYAINHAVLSAVGK